MPTDPATVDVTRGPLVESRHAVHVAVARPDGSLVAYAGDPDRLTTMRSCAKPWQAQPLVAAGGVEQFGLDDRTLAVMCASHMGLDLHAAAVRRGLEAIGLTAGALQNTVGDEESRLRHSCSGNHLAFLALSVLHGWDTDGYKRPDHPSQRAALAVVCAAAGVQESDVVTCTDGCGVVAFGLPLAVQAAMFAGLADSLPRQFGAMREHPEQVRGPGEFDTELMRTVPGCVAKGGAEGLGCVGLAAAGLGIAARAEDGAHRAVEPVLVAVIGELLGWSAVPEALTGFAVPAVRNSLDDRVGELRARVRLHAV
jgi:L-asparaginase II